MLTKERPTAQDHLETIRSGKYTPERLALLRHALSANRSISYYADWSEAETNAVIEGIDAQLPRKRKPFTLKARIRKHAEPPSTQSYLNGFAQNLPYRPYVSNDLETGLCIVGRDRAALYRYIQHNPPAMCHWLVFDCDYPNALARVVAQKLPLPNYIAVNPANGHSHLFYGLSDPVCVSEAGKANKPVWVLQRVEFALRAMLESDAGYMGFISKNLLHEHWEVQQVRAQLWKLLEFKEYFELPVRLPTRALEQGIGRNVTLFNTVRRLAYRQVLGYRLQGSKDAFKRYVQQLVEARNLEFTAPLHASEIKAIAKSISKWTWAKYTGLTTAEEFSKKQAVRGKLGGLAKGQANAEKRAKAVLMAAEGMSVREVAAALGVGKTSVQRWLMQVSR